MLQFESAKPESFMIGGFWGLGLPSTSKILPKLGLRVSKTLLLEVFEVFGLMDVQGNRRLPVNIPSRNLYLIQSSKAL